MLNKLVFRSLFASVVLEYFNQCSLFDNLKSSFSCQCSKLINCNLFSPETPFVLHQVVFGNSIYNPFKGNFTPVYLCYLPSR